MICSRLSISEYTQISIVTKKIPKVKKEKRSIHFFVNPQLIRVLLFQAWIGLTRVLVLVLLRRLGGQDSILQIIFFT